MTKWLFYARLALPSTQYIFSTLTDYIIYKFLLYFKYVQVEITMR